MIPDLPTPLILLLLAFAYAVVTSAMTVLAHRAHMRTRRHDLVVEIQARRLRYEVSLSDRQRSLQSDYSNSDVELVDDPPTLAGTITADNDPQRRAA